MSMLCHSVSLSVACSLPVLVCAAADLPLFGLGTDEDTDDNIDAMSVYVSNVNWDTTKVRALRASPCAALCRLVP